eukprot:1182369-Prorocentrum_minimum.AAC.5
MPCSFEKVANTVKPIVSKYAGPFNIIPLGSQVSLLSHTNNPSAPPSTPTQRPLQLGLFLNTDPSHLTIETCKARAIYLTSASVHGRRCRRETRHSKRGHRAPQRALQNRYSAD